ncbi:MAG: hypothetical protein V3U72_03395 [Candidatus Aenigmarchaeota archaeon]
MGDKPYIFVVDYIGSVGKFCESFFPRHEKGHYLAFYEIDMNFKNDGQILETFRELDDKSKLKLVIAQTTIPETGGFLLAKNLRKIGHKGGVILAGDTLYDGKGKIAGAYDREGNAIPLDKIIGMGVNDIISLPLENYEEKFVEILKKHLQE